MSTAKALSAVLLTAILFSGNACSQEISHATFNDDGAVQAPKQYYKWIHVGTPVTPHGLNGGNAPFPEFHNVYIEPTAFDHFMKTGKWPSGTQIIKERTLVRGGANCDGKTGACTEASGIGYFQGAFKGLELSIKDTKRFPDEPGGWVYFSFGNEGKPYKKTAEAFPTASCNECHQSGAETDFVFTQFYPILHSKKAK